MDNANVNVKDVEKLFEAGAHLGHKKNRLHPKARKYVYKIEQGISIIDLTHTARQLDEAKKFLSKVKKEEQKILVVATKKIINQFTEELCEKSDIPHVTTKWLPGLLTNFETIIKNVKKLKQLQEDRDSGNWDNMVKHERIRLSKEVSKLHRLYGGLLKLEKKPDVIIVIDTKKEKNVLNEAGQLGIKIVAVSDTNSNPELVEYPVVANDDSASSLEYLVKELVTAYAGK